MRSAVACASLLLAACGPVLLTGDADPHGKSQTSGTGVNAVMGEMTAQSSGNGGTSAQPGLAVAQPRDGAAPRALLSVTPSGCGRCFDLVASAVSGVPPYQYQWEDGSRSPTRRVCAVGQAREVTVTVVVQDAAATRSAPNVTVLAPEDVDAACEPTVMPAHRLCIMNPSFEGTPAINVGQNFDAVPWNACSNDPSVSNTPDIANDALGAIANAPKVQDGATYLSLGQGEQVSQALCEDVQGGELLSLQLDASRLDLAPGDMTEVFLEVWGGIAADCSQRQLLWASPKLPSSWTRYCINMKPTQYMNQITLRAKTNVASLAPEYLVLDHLVPVDHCP
jgi:hypothetical protein